MVILLELAVDLVEVDGRLFFEGVDVAGDVEIEVVVDYLLQRRDVRVFVDIFATAIRVDDLVDVLFGELVLVLAFDEFLACIDEQDVLCVPVLFEHENASGDSGAVEQVRRQADHGIEIVALGLRGIRFDERLANLGFGSPTEQDAVRQNDRHSAVRIQVVQAVQHKCIIGLRSRSQGPEGVEARVLELVFVVVPVRRIRRIGNDSIEGTRMIDARCRVWAVGPVGFERIGIRQRHVVERDSMHHEVHTRQIVCGRVQLLAVELDGSRLVASRQLILHRQQQRARAAGRIVHIEGVPGRRDIAGDHASQYLRYLMRRVELAALLARVRREHADQILVDLAKDVLALLILVFDAVDQLHDAVQGLRPVVRVRTQPRIAQVDVVEDAAEVLGSLFVQRGVLVEIIEDGLVITGNDEIVVDSLDQGSPRILRRDRIAQIRRDVFEIIIEIIASSLFGISFVNRLTGIDVEDIVVLEIVHLVPGQIAVEHEGQDVVLVFGGVHVAS